ncbi:sugar MFS transporter [Actinomadura sp. NEAU-AAG7]|uniref:MFS transporter n=1 Tax=Actinomadura sp. NEAU-AAG7 TaxID=2839640 RepID=UPI001BE3DB9B|nr:MFS transporter [Actinomadura sp. NEAU-AAG7]MBT2210103.1 MFS transporter [Actinomadura sp. NEAU-AAG7]
MSAAASVPAGTGTATGFTRAAAVGMCVSFVAIGALQAMYGPAVPAIRDRFDISSGAVGLALSVHFVGALAGVLFTPRLRQVGNRMFLVIALATMTAGCLGFAAAPVWPAALAAAFVAGVGFGWIDVGVNELFIEYYRSSGTGMLNLLHGNFGVGAVLAPLLVGALPGRFYMWAFVVCAVLSLAVLASVRGVHGTPPRGTREDVRWSAVGRLTGLFMIFFVLHVGVESGVGGWETTHLESLDWGDRSAAMATSTFWLAMTGVRFAISPVARHFSAQRILLASLVVMVAGLLLAHWGPVAAAGYFVTGLGVGPLFPTGLVWLTEKLPGIRGVTSYVIAVSMLGGVLPSLVGGSAGRWGADVIPTALAVLAVGSLLVALAIRALPALRPERQQPAPGHAADAAQGTGPG